MPLRCHQHVSVKIIMECPDAISKLFGWNCTTFLAFAFTVIDRVSVVFISLQRHLEELASHRLLNNLQQLVSGWDDNFPTLCRCIRFHLWQILCNIVSVMLGTNCWYYAILLLLCNIAGVVQYCWCYAILLVLCLVQNLTTLATFVNSLQFGKARYFLCNFSQKLKAHRQNCNSQLGSLQLTTCSYRAMLEGKLHSYIKLAFLCDFSLTTLRLSSIFRCLGETKI